MDIDNRLLGMERSGWVLALILCSKRFSIIHIKKICETHPEFPEELCPSRLQCKLKNRDSTTIEIALGNHILIWDVTKSCKTDEEV